VGYVRDDPTPGLWAASSAEVKTLALRRAVTVCKTVPCDRCMHKIQKAAVHRARRLTDLVTRLDGTGETTLDTGDAQRGLRLVSEMRQNAGDGGDARRMAHNPEVAGSNPTPATKARGPFSNRERASVCGL